MERSGEHARACACARQSACATGCLLFLLLIRSSGGRTRDGGGWVEHHRWRWASRRRESAATQRAVNNAGNARPRIKKSVFFICFMRMLRRSPSPVRQYHAPSLVNLFGAAVLSSIVLLREEGVRTYNTFAPFCSAPLRAAPRRSPFYSTTRDTRVGASFSVIALVALARALLQRFVDWSRDGAGGVYENVALSLSVVGGGGIVRGERECPRE